MSQAQHVLRLAWRVAVVARLTNGGPDVMTFRWISYTLAGLSIVSCESDAFGQAPGHNEISPYDFGKHDIGTKTSPVPVKLTNTEAFKIRFTAKHPSNSDYEIEKDGCASDVAAQGSCVLEIAFSPSATGDRNETLEIDRSDPDGKNSNLSALAVKLTGFGVLPDLGISSTNISFPDQRISTTSLPQVLKVNNNADGDLQIDKIVSTGDFLMDLPEFPKTLNKNESILVSVRFKPTKKGRASGMLSILNSSSRSPVNIYLSGGSTTSSWNELCSASPRGELFFVLVFSSFYWLAMIIVRWQRIARPTRELLRAAINSLGTELVIASENTSVSNAGKIATSISELLTNAESLLDKNSGRTGNFLFWSRGQEMAGWAYVHEAEIQMVPLLSSETMTTRLETIERKLRVSNDTVCVALANSIHQELSSPTSADNIERRRQALLAEGLNAHYGREDNSFADLVSWQNKTAWLVGCGLILIIALTGAVHQHSILFIVGATGGLLSRLSRSLDRKDVPTDYGASWTSLFLSPVSGSLGAWAGILLSNFAVQLKVLGTAFDSDWSDPCKPTTLAIAFVFGFSERLLDGVLDKLVEKTDALPKAPAPNPNPQDAGPSGRGGKDSASETLTITTQNLRDGKVGADYSDRLQAAGFSGTVKWSAAAGALPGGLKLQADGTVTGNPAAAAKAKFTASVEDEKSRSVSKEISININP